MADAWEGRNQAERLFASVARVRSAVAGALSHGQKARLEQSLADLDRLLAELDAVALVAAPADIERYSMPDCVWLRIADGERARAH